jgi:hypothetical protein
MTAAPSDLLLVQPTFEQTNTRYAANSLRPKLAAKDGIGCIPAVHRTRLASQL